MAKKATKQVQLKARDFRSVFTAETLAASDKNPVCGKFADGSVAMVWKVGRTIHAKLFDRSGKLVGDQYGNKCVFFTHWHFWVKNVRYSFNVAGGRRTT